MVEDGAFSHKVTIVKKILTLAGHPNRITGLKVTVILLNKWICLLVELQRWRVCIWSLRSRLVFFFLNWDFSHFKFCHNLSFWVLLQFEFFSFVTIWGSSQFEVCHNLSLVTIWVLSRWVFEFCHNLSFWVWSQFEFEFCHNLSFWVSSKVKFLSCKNLSFWVFSKFEFFSFVTIWFFEFCQHLSYGVLTQFEF